MYATFVAEKGNWLFGLKPWYRIPESDDEQYHRYLGYGEAFGSVQLGEHTLTANLRNNLRSDTNRFGIRVDWSFPLRNNLRGYLQYFNGYGESLIDYDDSVNRIGIGVLFTESP